MTTAITSSRRSSPIISSFTLSAWTLEDFYLRALGLVYAAAFGSLCLQWRGLYGPHGIVPVPEMGYLLYGGLALALVMTIGFAPRVVTILIWPIWFLTVRKGDTFLGYQWENLLLEAGLLAPFMAWRPNATVVFLHRFLLVRLLFMSGIEKLASGDRTWRALTALNYHFETQPLPNPLAWYAHFAPGWVLKGGVLFTYLAEIVVPLLFFLPRRYRVVGFGLSIALQAGIMATGNFAYFNLLTMALCLTILMDRPTPNLIAASATAMLFVIFAPRYGLFTSMTTDRLSLVIEGSQDKKEWREYVTPAQPVELDRAPPFVAPHQPRLDWQLWFAAMGRIEEEEWLQATLHALLRGEPDVVALFRVNPFPDAPPKYLRVLRYRYQFGKTTWWERRYLDAYTPVLSLKQRVNP